jgi:hypothetical protein
VKRLILRQLLAVFVIAGLIGAPLSASVAMAASAMAASAPAMQMSGDMPCCPDKPMPIDCDKCALMAMCVAKTFLAVPADALAEILPSRTRAVIPHSDPAMEGLGYSPPPRPPRSLVHSA